MERLTERRMRDKRFRRTENEILRAILKDSGYGTSKATFYRHHKSLNKIILEYENFILMRFNMTMRRLRRKDLKNKYFGMLVFILNHKKFFELFLKFGRRHALEEMVKLVRDDVKPQKVLDIYMAEVVGVVESWERSGFNEADISVVLTDIMYLTKTMWERLVPLTIND